MFLFENLDKISAPVEIAAPKYMEELDQGYGYILYRTTVTGAGEPLKLNIESVHDRAEVFVDGDFKTTYERWDMPTEEEMLTLDYPYGEEHSLDILCENMGRVNYGEKLLDKKGIKGAKLNVRRYHFGWIAYCLPMNDLAGLEFCEADAAGYAVPVFLQGEFEIEEKPMDSFIKLDGFTKGFVMINGFNIGRYFNPAGPQKTLYVPAPILKQGKNEIIVFESDKTDSLAVEFVDIPEL